MPPEHAEVVLRRRTDGATELRVNGVFVMDDVETTSERVLAERALERGARDVLVGGLGLGFTVRHLLADARVRRVLVAELHPEVVEAMREGTVPGDDLLADHRCEVAVGDVRDLVAAQAEGSFDAVLLDVDNGPDFLVHEHNRDLYGADFIARCGQVLRPGGTLAVWSMADSPALRTTLAEHLDDVSAERVPVRLQGRDEAYWVLTAVRPGGPTGPRSQR